MLINHNITVHGHRTSIRLEPEFWAALDDIAQRERLTVDELCSEIDSDVGQLSRTAAIRVFITCYMVRLSQGATEELRPRAIATRSDDKSIDDHPIAVKRIRAAG